MPVMEMSHRGKEFMSIAAEAEADLRSLLAIPANYKVLFLQGGATLQFAQVPMNLLRGNAKADYVITGEWSKKAIKEAKNYCDAAVAASSEDRSFTYAPKTWNVRKDAAYVHYCSNETIGGVEYHEVPKAEIPLVADASSHFLSRPLDVARFGLIYAGAQKNAGPAGLTIVIVRDDLIGQAAKGTPSVMDYKAQADADSMLNTPATYSMYIAGLVFADQAAGRPRGDGEAEHRESESPLRLPGFEPILREPGGEGGPLAHERAVHAERQVARRRLPQGRGGARPHAAQGTSLGWRHARLDLQRHADRRRAQARLLYEGVRKQAWLRGAGIANARSWSSTTLRRWAEALPPERYAVVKDSKDPWAILVRSQDLHSFEFGPSLRAVGRAGAGVNNISWLSKRGIPVFNAPGANANAVKELVLAGMLIAARNLAPALDFVQKQKPAPDLDKKIEEGKKQFAGFELPGHTLGVIGLGKIGSLVADAAIRLGMNVLGFDPHITVEAAWSLPSQVKRANSVDEVLKASHFVTLHVPLVEKTRHLVNAKNIEGFRTGAVLLNFSREGVVADEAVRKGIANGRLKWYVTDFPSADLVGAPGVIALPHLGASTGEAEDNSAVMVVDELRDYLEHGNLQNAVNFPDALMAREAPIASRSRTPTCRTCSAGSRTRSASARSTSITC